MKRSVNSGSECSVLTRNCVACGVPCTCGCRCWAVAKGHCRLSANSSSLCTSCSASPRISTFDSRSSSTSFSSSALTPPMSIPLCDPSKDLFSFSRSSSPVLSCSLSCCSLLLFSRVVLTSSPVLLFSLLVRSCSPVLSLSLFFRSLFLFSLRSLV